LSVNLRLSFAACLILKKKAFIGSALLKYTNVSPKVYTGCPTRYRTRHFLNNSNTNEDIATKQTHTTDTLLFISHTTNVLLFESRCNIFIYVRIIKEMPGSVASGTPCINYNTYRVSCGLRSAVTSHNIQYAGLRTVIRSQYVRQQMHLTL